MKKTIFLILCSAGCAVSSAQTSQASPLPEAYTLEQLKDSARQNNIAVREARHNIQAAAQQRKEAMTKFFPNVSGTGLWFNANRAMARMDADPSELMSPELGAALAQSVPAEALAALASPVSVSMMKNGLIGSLTAVQPLFAGGQIVNGNKLARLGEDVSRLQLSLSENEVEKATEQYFWQLASLQSKRKTVASIDTLLADIEKDVAVAVKAGVALPNDLLQVQLRRNDVASQRLKLENGIGIVRALLGQFCGLGRGGGATAAGRTDSYRFELVLPDLDAPVAALPSPAGWAAEVSQLPEYQLLVKQVEAVKLQKQMELGKSLPSVAVGAGYNYHNLLENDRSFAMVFATVSVPLSDWWGGSHAVRRRRIEQKKAEEQLADNAELLAIRMENAWNGVVEATEQLKLSRRSVEQAQENLRLNRNYYRAGTARMSDLLEAESLYQQCMDKLTDAYAELQNKRLEYRQATGR